MIMLDKLLKLLNVLFVGYNKGTEYRASLFGLYSSSCKYGDKCSWGAC